MIAVQRMQRLVESANGKNAGDNELMDVPHCLYEKAASIHARIALFDVKRLRLSLAAIHSGTSVAADFGNL